MISCTFFFYSQSLGMVLKKSENSQCSLLTIISLRMFSASVSSMLLVTSTSLPDIMPRWLPPAPQRWCRVTADELLSSWGGVGNETRLRSMSWQHTDSYVSVHSITIFKDNALQYSSLQADSPLMVLTSHVWSYRDVIPSFTTAKVGTWNSDPRGLQSWADLV